MGRGIDQHELDKGRVATWAGKSPDFQVLTCVEMKFELSLFGLGPNVKPVCNFDGPKAWNPSTQIGHRG